jgi:hypothetical protein
MAKHKGGFHVKGTSAKHEGKKRHGGRKGRGRKRGSKK